jgi:hypothetical protein
MILVKTVQDPDLRLRAAASDPDQCDHSPGVLNPLATLTKIPDLVFASGICCKFAGGACHNAFVVCGVLRTTRNLVQRCRAVLPA